MFIFKNEFGFMVKNISKGLIHKLALLGSEAYSHTIWPADFTIVLQ